MSIVQIRSEPQREGVQPGSAEPTVVFCERWKGRDHRPSGVISESAARRRDCVVSQTCWGQW